MHCAHNRNNSAQHKGQMEAPSRMQVTISDLYISIYTSSHLKVTRLPPGFGEPTCYGPPSFPTAETTNAHTFIKPKEQDTAGREQKNQNRHCCRVAQQATLTTALGEATPAASTSPFHIHQARKRAAWLCTWLGIFSCPGST